MTASADGTVRLTRSSSGRCARVYMCETGPVVAVAASPGGGAFACYANGFTRGYQRERIGSNGLQIWGLAAGGRRALDDESKDDAADDLQRRYSYDDDDEEEEDRRPQNAFLPRDARRFLLEVPTNRGGGCVAYSPCGRLIATASDSATVRRGRRRLARRGRRRPDQFRQGERLL